MWCTHAADQAAVQPLRDPVELGAYDGFAMVSSWQQEAYRQTFAIDPARMAVLRNAIAPAFAGKFLDGSAILPRKSVPPILAYTSTPFRGLNVLIDAFPSIREAVAGTRLQVFSSMKVYNVSAPQDEAEFGSLYRRCREVEGVEYRGSMRSTTWLATWSE